MALLNYTTKIPAAQTASEIIAVLSQKGATQIGMTFGARGQPTGLRWKIDTAHGPLDFALPVNVEAVFNILTKQRVLRTKEDIRREQAERTAWRILKEWIVAQMALIETGMVEMEEVFLPYMLRDGRTFYQALVESEFKALPSGD